MNTDLRKQEKNDFEIYFFKLMNNLVFGKTMENVRKHRDYDKISELLIFLEIIKQRHYLASEPNYHTTQFFAEHLLAIEMKKKNRNTYE